MIYWWWWFPRKQTSSSQIMLWQHWAVSHSWLYLRPVTVHCPVYSSGEQHLHILQYFGCSFVCAHCLHHSTINHIQHLHCPKRTNYDITQKSLWLHLHSYLEFQGTLIPTFWRNRWKSFDGDWCFFPRLWSSWFIFMKKKKDFQTFPWGMPDWIQMWLLSGCELF